MAPFLVIVGILLLGLIVDKAIEIFSVLFASPIFWIALAVVVVLAVIILVKTLKKIKAEEEEKERQEAEQRRLAELRKAFEETRRKAREEAERREREQNTLRFKCPYCGTGYAEYPAKPSETLRICDGGFDNFRNSCCLRHFYPTEDQTPRTSQDEETLTREQQDILRVNSPEFAPLIAEIKRRVLSTACGKSGYLVFHGCCISVNNYFSWNSTIHHDTLTYAGCLALAKVCISYIGEQFYSFSVYKSPFGGIMFQWVPRED